MELKKMKTAVLGIGGMGKTVIEHLLKSPYIDDIAAYDINPVQMDEFSGQKKVRMVKNLNDILSDNQIKLVFITAANNAHRDLTISCLNARKAVMCEKPIANTMSDAEEMVSTAERLGVFLQIGFELHYSKLYTKVKEWIDAGLLGRVVNTNCFYICCEFFGKKSWRIKKSLAGGMFLEKLCHYVDLPRWWIGDKVVDVFSVCAPNVVNYYEIRDNYNTVCRYENGAVSQLSFMMAPAATFAGDPLKNWVEQQNGDGHYLRYFICGTKGAAETDVFGRSIKRWEFSDGDEGLISKLVEQLSWPSEEDHFYFHNTTDQTLDIVERVSKGLAPRASAKDALESMRLSYAAELSADTGRIVALNEI
jgi:predicted dehydrogenase